MAWQDGLALLIVAVATLALLRSWLPASLLRFWQKGGVAAQRAAPAGGCCGCSSGSSCAKTPTQIQVQVRAYPVPTGRRR
ncbi:MAG TPA: hypothetical protein PKI41_05435 [Candidatus Competibacteraceae bacterium]|nr:MAG: hypothetical protein EKK71_07650 [Candidatus Competibacteraceae bacterium]HOB61548.1 hypothetical protein [Candidatus Competibacteraceae bacterium]HQA24991.1 hypothetical protein [Candidatus Competibacteraceae bacterium]HQD55991.1 hypothetical protein [Candidatus Competibacteraceae bacterium]